MTDAVHRSRLVPPGARAVPLDDPAAAEDISRRGRTAVKREFDWPRVTDQVERIYREVLEAKRPAVRTPIIPTSGRAE